MILLCALLFAVAQAAPWETVLDHVIPGVVAIRVSAPRAFDTEGARSMVATGFVVDAERGILLTNRHVVSPGPVVAEAVFANHEEVPLTAIYRDPVHDFGFYRYDPKDVRYMTPVALPLYPEGARVGVDIRVVGNDAGEKISILAGTLARLDRDAPDYGLGSYNDFDTFYYQAASSTSGGSSGSPVLDPEGRVIALNAGARREAASSYFLPLDRVVRALQLIQAGQPVARGTLQASFKYTPMDVLRRLGLRAETEADVRQRFPKGTGLLVVDRVIRGGTAEELLQPGDILLRIDGEPIAAFVPLDARLDARVGATVHLDLERGGVPRAVDLPVSDLQALTPSAWLEYSDGVLHPVSYQMAWSYGVSLKGVVVVDPGYALGNAGLQRGAVLQAVGDTPVSDLDTLEAALIALPDGTRTRVRYTTLANPLLSAVAVMTVDHTWFGLTRCALDPATGAWPCRPSPAAAPPTDPPAVSVPEVPSKRGPERRLARALVGVRFTVPVQADGVYGGSFRGSGLVVDAAQGLVVVDRDTVPVPLGDVTLTFGAEEEVPGRVVYVHPAHNLAVIAYDPKMLTGVVPQAATLLPEAALREGQEVWVVGLDRAGALASRKTQLAEEGPIRGGLPSPPFFRESGVEVWSVGGAPDTMGGVVADRKGRVLGLWASYVDLSDKQRSSTFFALPAAELADILAPLSRGETPAWPDLGCHLSAYTIEAARGRGMPEAVADALREARPYQPTVLGITGVLPGGPSDGLLEEGDLLAQVNGAPATRMRQVEAAALQGPVRLGLYRGATWVEVMVTPRMLGSDGATRVVVWAGAVVQDNPQPALAWRGISGPGAYVSLIYLGSPASRYRLGATNRVLAVDDVQTPDLDAFQAAVAALPPERPVRVKVVDLDGRVSVITLKPDPIWWPTSVLAQQDGAWRRAPLAPAAGAR